MRLGERTELYRSRVYPNVAAIPRERQLPAPRVAIVFGAGLWSGNGPSPILYDRIATAVDLYHAGRVRKLLVDG
ncbi:MAG: hypothetical protein WKF84_25660 [Pyrinomonadaceae bacterium]